MQIRNGKIAQRRAWINIGRSAARIACAALAFGGFAAGRALAIEGPSPFQPGSSTGAPAGALPPPGTYVIVDTEHADGTVYDNNGNKVPVYGWKDAITPIIVWVPKAKVLGAAYAVYIVQPIIAEGVDATGVGGGPATAHGYANTTLSPLNLSWALSKGLYGKIGFSVQVPDGTYLYAGTGTKTHELPQSPGNHTLTYEPDFAISWLPAGWDLTAHSVFDFQTKDTVTNYQSGSVFYTDFTVTKTMRKWTVGAVGNWSQQFTNDVQNGMVVNGNGNKFQHVLLGPMIGSDLGGVGVKFTGLFGMRARNDLNVSFFHLQFGSRL